MIFFNVSTTVIAGCNVISYSCKEIPVKLLPVDHNCILYKVVVTVKNIIHNPTLILWGWNKGQKSGAISQNEEIKSYSQKVS